LGDAYRAIGKGGENNATVTFPQCVVGEMEGRPLRGKHTVNSLKEQKNGGLQKRGRCLAKGRIPPSKRFYDKRYYCSNGKEDPQNEERVPLCECEKMDFLKRGVEKCEKMPTGGALSSKTRVPSRKI